MVSGDKISQLQRPDKLKVAVVGLGNQALEDHIPGVVSSRRAELVAICDPNPTVLNKLQGQLGVPAYASHRELLKNEELDFLVVATPHDQYHSIIQDACLHRVHVLKEKPFARNLEEARALKRMTDAAGLQVMTTFQRRFNPVYTTFFSLIDHIGSPFFLDIRYTIFTDSPHTGWRGRRAQAGGGCLIDMGYHMVDLLIWYFDLPSRVFASLSAKAVPWAAYDAEDTAVIVLSYPNGLHGTLLVSRFYAPKTEYFKVIGTDGIVEVERGSIRRRTSSGEVCENLARDKAWPSASTAQIDYFCQVIQGSRDNIGSPAYHLKHAAFTDACYESARRGVSVDPNVLLEEKHAPTRAIGR